MFEIFFSIAWSWFEWSDFMWTVSSGSHIHPTLLCSSPLCSHPALKMLEVTAFKSTNQRQIHFFYAPGPPQNWLEWHNFTIYINFLKGAVALTKSCSDFDAYNGWSFHLYCHVYIPFIFLYSQPLKKKLLNKFFQASSGRQFNTQNINILTLTHINNIVIWTQI